MSEDVAIVVAVKGDVSGGRVIKKSLDDIAASGDKATVSSKRLELQAKATAVAGDAMGRAFAAISAVIGLSQIARMADQYTMLESRIKLATRSTAEFTAAFNGLRQISNQTGASLSDAVDVFQRLSFVRDEIGATINQMVTFTGTVQKMGVMSGASTTAMSAGLLQLGQALSAGVVRAEEFNSVVENTPVIAKAIADQFGVTTGQLRQLVLKGLVDSADVFNAVLNEAAGVEQKYAQMPVTIGRALSQLQNQFQEFIGVNAQASGAAMAMVGVLDTVRLAVYGLGKAFDLIANGIGIVAQSILKIIEELANGTISAINWVTQQANRIPGVNTPLMGKVKFAADWSDINSAAGSAYNELFSGKTPTTVFDKALGNDREASASTQVRAMSKDYAELAKNLGTATKLTKEQREALNQQKRIQDQLTDAVKDSRTETEQLYDTIKEQEALRPFAKTAEQATAIAKNIKNAQDELEKLRIKAELDSPTGKAFTSLAKEIDDDFKDAFKSVFTETEGGFKKMFDGLKASFKNFLADLAYQAAVRPIFVSLVSGVGSSLGLSSGAIASTLGGASGGGGGFSLTSLSGLLGKGLSGTFGGFGTSLGTGVGKLFGMDAYSALELGDKFGGFLSSAGSWANIGGGFAGGTLASVLGLGNKNPWVNAGASTAGALIGQAAIPIPFVGAAVGSFLGSSLGGLFGGGKPTDGTQGGGVDLATGALIGVGGMTGKKYSAGNASFRDSVLNEVSELVKLFKSVGATTTGRTDVAIGSRDGLRLNTYDQYGVRNFGNNSQAFINAMMEAVLRGTTGLTGTFKTIVDKIGVSDTKKLAAAFEFGKQFDEFTKATDKTPVDVLNEALTALNAQFDGLKQQALSLGLPIDKLSEAYEKQKTITMNSLKAQMAGFQSFEQMTGAFDSFFNSQALGTNSSLTPMQKLQTAQSAFGDLLTKAQGGDLSVTPNLLSAASTLIDQGRNVYASSVDFSNLEGFVRSSVQGVASQAGYDGQNVAYSIVSTNQTLVEQTSNQTQAIQDMKAEIYRLNAKISVLLDKAA